MPTRTLVGLKRYRLLAGLTQQELAAQLGITRQVVADYESGRTTPRLPLARQLARVLGAPIDLLFPPSGDTGAAA
jgi:putative transcriptional regulator